jgi:hypothetical protein
VSDVTSDHTDATEPNPRQGDPRLPTVSPDPPPVAGASDVALSVQEAPPVESAPRSWGRIATKVASGAAALFLFVLALQLMKNGAGEVAPSIRENALFENGASTLGAGWLGAYLVLSGSPIAAVSLGLFSGGAITKLQTCSRCSRGRGSARRSSCCSSGSCTRCATAGRTDRSRSAWGSSH